MQHHIKTAGLDVPFLEKVDDTAKIIAPRLSAIINNIIQVEFHRSVKIHGVDSNPVVAAACSPLHYARLVAWMEASGRIVFHDLRAGERHVLSRNA